MKYMLIAVWIGWAAWVPAQDSMTLSGFEVPEYDKDMRLRSKLFGDFARVRPDGMVDIKNMKIEFYDDDTVVETRVTTPECTYNRTTRDARSAGDVRIARQNMVITGTGFSWNAEGGEFKIFKNARVELRDLKSRMEAGEEE